MLLIGGSTSNNDWNTAALYNSSAGTWTNTGSLNFSPFEHTVSVLSNGKVLVTGGRGRNETVLSSTELYAEH